MVRILLVLSGSDHWTLNDGTRHPTGYWADEFVVSHRRCRRQGVDVDIATPAGVRPTVDQMSLDPQRLGDKDKAADLRKLPRLHRGRDGAADGGGTCRGRRHRVRRPPWQSHVIADDNLMTGQNPASSRAATDRTPGELAVLT